MKTKMWYVQLVSDPDGESFYALRVGLTPVPNALHTVRFRFITARAAVRQYVRFNLPYQMYLRDDGGNQPEDLRWPTAHNRYRPRNEMRHAKRLAAPVSGWRMAPGGGPYGYRVEFNR